MRKLARKERLGLIKKIAEYNNYEECMDWLLEFCGKKISKVQYHDYKGSVKWKPIIQKYRDKFNETLADVPLTSKRKRLEELQGIYDVAKKKQNLERAQSVIRDCKEEVEGSGGSGAGNFYLQINNEFSSLTDAELSEMKIKEIERLERLKKLVNRKELVHAEIREAETYDGDSRT